MGHRPDPLHPRRRRRALVEPPATFAGFDEVRCDVGEVTLYARVGGSGPPLVALHGYPQSHRAWAGVASELARHHTLVVPDLRGYGQSGIVAPDATHAAYSKRTMARDIVALMSALGHERFAIAGHDRGARVAYRLALDAPERVRKLACLDIMPTLETFEAMDYRGAFRAYHWYFLAQPAPLPERMIEADIDGYIAWTLRSWWASEQPMDPQAIAEYATAFHRPGAIAAACEDYRAGYSVDLAADRADRAAGRRIACPVLVLWGAGPTAERGTNFIPVWQRWADDVRGAALPCGHFLMEEAPQATAAALVAFFAP